MDLNRKYTFFIFFIFLGYSCASSSKIEDNIVNVSQSKNIKILSLGDSYTIGTSVCDKCRFPEQLVDSLQVNVEGTFSFPLTIIAKNGWTTTDLLKAIETENISKDYSLVTLLIGVNNQYQRKPFSQYETEFNELRSLMTHFSHSSLINLDFDVANLYKF